MEEWRVVPGFPAYEVSDCGRVRRAIPSRRAPIGYLLKQYVNRKGYLWVALDGEQRKGKYVHALVATAFIGPRPVGQETNHKDCDKTNNTVGNLEYCSVSANAVHARKHGLYWRLRGEVIGTSKLSEASVRDIKRLLPSCGVCALARQFGVHKCTISDIKHGRTWSHVAA